MLDFIGIIVLVAAIIVSINALTGAMPISTSQRLAVSVGAGERIDADNDRCDENDGPDEVQHGISPYV